MVGDWRVGFSGGFTRRGNSAVPPAAVDGADPQAVPGSLEDVEELYAQRGVPAVVRVDPAAMPALDAFLASRGYAPAAPTTVMVAPTDRTLRRPTGRALPAPTARSLRTLTEGPEHPPARGEDLRTTDADLRTTDADLRITSADAPDAQWLDAWLGVKATSTTDRALADRLVRGAPARYLTARDDDGVVGVLRAAPSGHWVGLSCLAVAERARRRGIGRRLTEHALDQASASWAFLQVEEANRAAAALYAALGFTVADRYHYRQR